MLVELAECSVTVTGTVVLFIELVVFTLGVTIVGFLPCLFTSGESSTPSMLASHI